MTALALAAKCKPCRRGSCASADPVLCVAPAVCGCTCSLAGAPRRGAGELKPDGQTGADALREQAETSARSDESVSGPAVGCVPASVPSLGLWLHQVARVRGESYLELLARVEQRVAGWPYAAHEVALLRTEVET